MTRYFYLSCLLCLSLLLCHWGGRSQSLRETRDVIARYAGDKLPMTLALSLPKVDGKDVFRTRVSQGILHIEASSPVAACRGFYDYVKRGGYGISSWTGNRLEVPATLPDQAEHTVISPYRHHYYFNVVTSGYSTPYWDWARWEQEIDWMALHGVDMPLALVANEAISARVWKRLGLTDQEIADYFVGPAHFPWMRMGNISGIDGPLPKAWHKAQIALQHKILKRMRSLGMKPICPGFAGFVPKAMQRVYPEVELIETSWSGGAFHNWMLSPQTPLFTEIGKLFVEEWEREFGKNDYYIVDSFNEMEIPFPPKDTQERYTLLADYGDKVYQSIKLGNPDAVWVMQGWMFGYQRHIWDYQTLQALVSQVPDDKMLLLDLAVDYNRCFWRSEVNWEYYKGMFGKQWVYSVIPNMGGKTGLTGMLDFYANGHLDALRSSNKGRLTGYGMAPEGIENNEVLYEMICDAGWTDTTIDVTQWLQNYSQCRYGIVNQAVMDYWDGMRKSVYGSFTDHPRYNWQFRPGLVRRGSINANDDFYRGIEQLSGAISTLGDTPLFRADMVEMTAHYLGGKLEILVQAIEHAYQHGYAQQASTLEQTFERLMMSLDRLLASHPTLRLDRWLHWARQYGDTPAHEKYYEKNARRIVTIWGPPVDDYSARIWSGLIRDYYLPRWKHYFEAKRTGQSFDFATWERHWVEDCPKLSVVTPYPDVLEACSTLISEARWIDLAWLATLSHTADDQVGGWAPVDMHQSETTLSWSIPVGKLKSSESILLEYLRGADSLEICQVSVEMDGVIVYSSDQHSTLSQATPQAVYTLPALDTATGNNSCLLHVQVKRLGGQDLYGVARLQAR